MVVTPCENDVVEGKIQIKKEFSFWNPLTSNSVADILKVFHPRTVWMCYTFQWLQWSKSGKTGENLKEKLSNDQTNISLLCALLVFVWIEMVLDGEDYSDDNTIERTTVLCLAFVAITFHVLGMVNSAILLMLLNELDDDEQCRRFAKRIGTNILVPMILFYLGVLFGIGAIIFYIWMKYNFVCFMVVSIVVIFFGFLLNAPYYQYNVLCLESSVFEDIPAIVLKDNNMIQKYWKSYIEIHGTENVDPTSFKCYIIENYGIFNNDQQQIHKMKLAYVTEKRVEQFVEKSIQEFIS